MIDYDVLRERILKDAARFKYSSQVGAALTIFNTAGDQAAISQLIHSLYLDLFTAEYEWFYLLQTMSSNKSYEKKDDDLAYLFGKVPMRFAKLIIYEYSSHYLPPKSYPEITRRFSGSRYGF